MGNSHSAAADQLFDSNDSVSTKELLTPIKGLHDNLTRQRLNRDPLKYYEIITVLGVGSMGSVSKVKKRSEAVGGSSRAHYLKSESRSHILERLALIFKLCCGTAEEKERTRDILHIPSMRRVDMSSHSRKSADSISGSSHGVSSMVTFGHQDTFFALKSIALDKTTSKALIDEMKNEVEMLKKMDHPHIVRAMETFDFKHQIYIIMELCSGGDLYTRDPYTEEEAANITASVLSAVSYMHSMGITHRDLKYENIMFSTPKPTADVKIIDFGLSKKYAKDDDEMMHDAVGTVYSMSPEVLTGDYTNKVDIWSVGVLAFMLLSSSMPFYGKTRKDVIRKLLKGKFSFKARTWKYISIEAKQFVVDLLEFNPVARPTADMALHSPWLESLLQRRRSQSVDYTRKMDQIQASIENFAEYSTLKKLALMVVAHKSTSDEIGFLEKMFREFDCSNKGDVTFEDFTVALEGYEYTKDECKRLFRAMDLDNSGLIHYSEFIAATIEARGTISEERLAEAFDRIDADDSGFITVGDLRELLGESVPSSYLNTIIDEAEGMGLSHDHKVDYAEFLGLWSAENDSRRASILDLVVKRRESSAYSRNNSTAEESSQVSPEFDDIVSEMSMDTSEEGSNAGGDNLFKNNKEISIRGHAELHGNRGANHGVNKGPRSARAKDVRIVGIPPVNRNSAQYADI